MPRSCFSTLHLLHHTSRIRRTNLNACSARSMHRRQKRKLLLNIRGQMKQLHDLCHASPSHVAETSQLSVVLNLLIPQQPFKADRECHQSRDPENTWSPGSTVVSCRSRSEVLRRERPLVC